MNEADYQQALMAIEKDQKLPTGCLRMIEPPRRKCSGCLFCEPEKFAKAKEKGKARKK